ncbi:DUF4247 domain-containing protein [Halobacillus litoralis]|uniref:DUF4247 domain-containing protein n=1 Tax=Halobacillus litoralis TaxID=45668 RepID=UPI001CD4D259|nr:DUF4247 domain-containing protein [Halobacillus litoralis]MCA0969818.1 DUF4247 domain-containing protein [Halobacillus litoralis]
MNIKDLAGLAIAVIVGIILLFNVFGEDDDPLRGMTGSYTQDTYNELPDEPSRNEIIDNIDNYSSNGTSSENDNESQTQDDSDDAQTDSSSSKSIEELIQVAFPLLDTVNRNNGTSKIYMTRELTLPEVVQQLSDEIQPEEISQRQDDRQVLVYPEHFVIVQESNEEPGLVTIELANDRFVRENYSPSFFNGMLTAIVLNRVLDADDWFDRRRSSCRQSNDCYGGYGMYGSFGSNSSGNSGSFRGSSTRGGGPGTGK